MPHATDLRCRHCAYLYYVCKLILSMLHCRKPETLCELIRRLKPYPEGMLLGRLRHGLMTWFDLWLLMMRWRANPSRFREGRPLLLRSTTASAASEFGCEMRCRRFGTSPVRPRMTSRRFFDALRSQTQTRPSVATIAVSRFRPHPTSATNGGGFAHTVRLGFGGCFSRRFLAVSV